MVQVGGAGWGVCSQEECLVQGCLLGGVPGPGGGDPSVTDGYCCGQYASYWNAFLFIYVSKYFFL